MRKTRKKNNINEKSYWEDSVNLSKEVENCFSVPNKMFTPFPQGTAGHIH